MQRNTHMIHINDIVGLKMYANKRKKKYAEIKCKKKLRNFMWILLYSKTTETTFMKKRKKKYVDCEHLQTF